MPMLEVREIFQKYNQIMSKNNTPIYYREEKPLYLSSYTLSQIKDEIEDFAKQFGIDPSAVRICPPVHQEEPLYLECDRPESEKEKERRLKRLEKEKQRKKCDAEEKKAKELALYEKLKAKYGQ